MLSYPISGGKMLCLLVLLQAAAGSLAFSAIPQTPWTRAQTAKATRIPIQDSKSRSRYAPRQKRALLPAPHHHGKPPCAGPGAGCDGAGSCAGTRSTCARAMRCPALTLHAEAAVSGGLTHPLSHVQSRSRRADEGRSAPLSASVCSVRCLGQTELRACAALRGTEREESCAPRLQGAEGG
eukprot:3941787-Rhodomonas_salina.2